MQARSSRAVAMLAALVIACAGSETAGSSNLLTGTYAAVIFDVTPTGQAPVNVIGAGGSLSITIDASGATTGTLNIPSSVTGGAPLVASMAGTATITALTVEFDQSADTFVRDLTWTRTGTALSVMAQAAGSATYTITLVHQ